LEQTEGRHLRGAICEQVHVVKPREEYLIDTDRDGEYDLRIRSTLYAGSDRWKRHNYHFYNADGDTARVRRFIKAGGFVHYAFEGVIQRVFVENDSLMLHLWTCDDPQSADDLLYYVGLTTTGDLYLVRLWSSADGGNTGSSATSHQARSSSTHGQVPEGAAAFDANWSDRELRYWGHAFPNQNVAVRVRRCYQKVKPVVVELGEYVQTLDETYLVVDMQVRALAGSSRIDFWNDFHISCGGKRVDTRDYQADEMYRILNPGRMTESYTTRQDETEVGSSSSATATREIPFCIAYETSRGTIMGDPPADHVDFIPRISGLVWLHVDGDSLQLTTLDLKPRYGYVKQRARLR